MQRFICVLCVFLLLATTGAAFAQDEAVEEVWYWGIDAEHATLVAYNLSGKINVLDVYLDPLDPQATVLRIDSDSALALIDGDGHLIVYELTSDSAKRVASFGE